MSDLILGVDIGTTSVKAGVFALDGSRVFDWSQSYPTHRAAGGVAEQDPADWIARLDASLAEIAAAGLADRIAAVGLASQVNTHVFVDTTGQAVAPAITWADGRAAEEAAALDAVPSAEDRVRWWGAALPIDASHALARMAWMAKHEPTLWAATESVLLPKDYVIRYLTGETVSDPMSNIGLVGLDLAYVPDLLALMAGAHERLAPLADPLSVAGETRLPGAARAVPVATGTMDAWAGMFGVGVRTPGQAMYLSGTSEILGVISDDVAPAPGVLVFPRWRDIRLHAGPTQSGGAAIGWYCQLFETTPAEMAASVTPQGARRAAPLFLPHLAGERAPLWDPVARGMFLGLSAEMTAGDLARGVYEGVALSVRLLLETLDQSAKARTEILNCGGGGFGSEIWNQIRADAMGRPLREIAVRDPGVLGAAAMASVAGGLHPDLDTALDGIVRYARTYTPNPDLRGLYDDLYGLYRPTYEATRAASHALSQMEAR